MLLRQVWIAGARVERAVRPDQKGIPGAAGGGFELPACLVRHGLKTPFRSPGAGVERVYEAAARGERRCDEDSVVGHLRSNIEFRPAARKAGVVPDLVARSRIEGEDAGRRDAVDPAIGQRHSVWTIV